MYNACHVGTVMKLYLYVHCMCKGYYNNCGDFLKNNCRWKSFNTIRQIVVSNAPNFHETQLIDGDLVSRILSKSEENMKKIGAKFYVQLCENCGFSLHAFQLTQRWSNV